MLDIKLYGNVRIAVHFVSCKENPQSFYKVFGMKSPADASGALWSVCLCVYHSSGLGYSQSALANTLHGFALQRIIPLLIPYVDGMQFPNKHVLLRSGAHSWFRPDVLFAFACEMDLLLSR